MVSPQSVAIKIRSAIRQVDAISPSIGIPLQQLKFVKEVLSGYLVHIESVPDSLRSCDLNLVSRLVLEYWPITLEAGEAVIEAEHAVRRVANK